MKKTLIALIFLLQIILPAVEQRSGIFVDTRDRQTYRTIRIGSQVWLADNLNYNIDGSWHYENLKENGQKFGRLYSWAAAKKACPAGWHLPSDDEWKQLEREMGISHRSINKIDYRDPGKNVKSKLQMMGFNINMAGCRTFADGTFIGLGQFTFYWTSTPYKKVYAWKRAFDRKTEGVGRHAHNQKHANSVRCIKD